MTMQQQRFNAPRLTGLPRTIPAAAQLAYEKAFDNLEARRAESRPTPRAVTRTFPQAATGKPAAQQAGAQLSDAQQLRKLVLANNRQESLLYLEITANQERFARTVQGRNFALKAVRADAEAHARKGNR